MLRVSILHEITWTPPPQSQRTLDLCQAITEQLDFQALKESVDAFMSDELLKFQYQQINDVGQLLQMKQADGLELKPEEIAPVRDAA